MSKIRALIVDDELGARNVLRKLIEKYCDSVDVIGEANNVKNAVKVIHEQKPDLVFLDIKMPDYDGYEITRFIEDIDFDIIFVTAFDQYAIKAFELSAVDYILKPVDRNRLIEAVQKVGSKIANQGKLKSYEVLLESMSSQNLQKIVIPESGNRRVVSIDEIVAVEADGAYCKIHLQSEPTIVLGKNLKYFESILDNSTTFFRSHRTWLINLDYVTQVNKSELTILLGKSLVTKIARSRFPDFELVIR